MLSKGDEVFAKVLSHQPLTLGLDNFVSGGKLSPAQITAALAKLGLQETELTKSVIKNVTANKQPLVKSKLQRMIEYMEASELTLDEMQTALLINIVWSDDKDHYKGTLDSFAKIFDVTFEELSRQIFLSVLKINDLNYPIEFYEKLNERIIYQINDNINNITALRDKTNGFLSLAEYFKTITPALNILQSEELDYLKKYLLKYVLQKAMYTRFDYNPEFAIVKGKKSLQLINYNMNLVGSGDITTYNVSANKFESVYGELSYSFMINEASCRGKIIAENETLNRMKSGLENLRKNISKHLGMDIELILQSKNSKETSINATVIKSIDFQV